MIKNRVETASSRLFAHRIQYLKNGRRMQPGWLTTSLFAAIGNLLLINLAAFGISSSGNAASVCNLDLSINKLAIYEGQTFAASYSIAPNGCTTCAELNPVYSKINLLIVDNSVESGSRYLKAGESPPIRGGGYWGSECDLYRGDQIANHGSLSGTVTRGNTGGVQSGTSLWAIVVKDGSGGYEPRNKWKYAQVEVLPAPASFHGFSPSQETMIQNAVLDIAESISGFNRPGLLNRSPNYSHVRDRLLDELHNLDNISFINKKMAESGSVVCAKWEPYTNRINLNFDECNANEVTVLSSVLRELLIKVGAARRKDNGMPMGLSEDDVNKIVSNHAPDYYAECVVRINEYRQKEGKPPLRRNRQRESCADAQAKTDSNHPTIPHYATKNSQPSCGVHSQNSCPGFPSVESILDPIGGCLKQMYDEGPGQNYQKHGHYINMMSSLSTEVSCGIYIAPGGDVWAEQNFYQ